MQANESDLSGLPELIDDVQVPLVPPVAQTGETTAVMAA
jgi:hypothetical protein